jgi:hypothetical protein
MSGYYPAFGACERCEKGTPAILAVRRIGFFALGLVLASIVVFAVVFAVNKRVGSDLYDSIRRVIMFVTASIFILQIISRATRALRFSAPPMLRSMFKALEVLQFSSIAPPPECLDKPHLFLEYLINYGICLLLLLVYLLANIKCSTLKRTCCGQGSTSTEVRSNEGRDSASADKPETVYGYFRPYLRRLTFMLLSLLYAVTVNNTLALLHCRTEVLSVSRYAELDQSGLALFEAAIPATGTRAIRSCELDPRGIDCEKILGWSQTHLHVRILDINPSFVCYEGTHLQVVWLAYIILFVYVIGYPVGSFLYLRHRIRGIMLRGSDAGEWTAALAADRARRVRYVQEATTYWVRGIRYTRVGLFGTGGRYEGQAHGYRAACTPSCLFLGLRGHRDERAIRTAEDIVDDNEDIKYDTAISPVASDVYRASIFFQRHLDFACLSALSFVLVFAQEHPRLQLSLTLGILILHTISVLLGRPYTAEASFNHAVRVCANFVAMMGAVASFMSYARDGTQDAARPSTALGPFSYFMLFLCIGLAILFIASFFFTLVKGAKLDRERELKRTKGNRMLVPPSLAAGRKIDGDAWSTNPAVLERELSEQESIRPVQARGQRVQKIRVACEHSPSILTEARGRQKLDPMDFAASPAGRGGDGSSQRDDYMNEWVIGGLEAQENPLFVATETGSFCPPRSGGHKVSDW